MTSTIVDHIMPQEAKLGYGDYLRFRALVHEHSGLYFPEKRRAELERGVRRAFAASTCTTLDEYYHLLHDPGSNVVHLEQLVNALTVGETHFFRDSAQFDVLVDHALPQIIERRRPLRTLRIWSAGCASGEEPYSIAMLLLEMLPDLDEWAITILGTDINTEVLDRARKASYSDWAFREERAKQWRERYFRRRGNRYELTERVKRMVTFSPLNLAEEIYPAYETNTTLMDLILCRNVMMYFTEPVTRRIVTKFYNALTEGGWLVVGHAEHSLITYRRFQVQNFPDAILYRRAEDQLLAPPTLDWLTLPVDLERQSAPKMQTVILPQPPPLEEPETEPEPPREAEPTPLQEPDQPSRIERARELLDYGRSEEARDLLLQLSKSEQASAVIYSLLGKAYANLGLWQEAADWCQRAVNLDKLALEAYYTLALVLQHQDELRQAIEAMKKVVYIDRQHVLGHFGLANLYHQRGTLAQALKSLDNANRLLDSHSDDEVLPGSSGVTVGRLRDAIIRQQQTWSAGTGDSLGRGL